MVESDEYSDRHRNERPEKISEDEHIADAANESAQDREARRLHNRQCAKRRRDANDQRALIQRDLNVEFAAAQDAGFNTPAANIAGITAVLAGNPDPQVQTAVHMVQRALLQINQQNPMPSVSRGRGEGEGESQVSRTPRGHPRRQAAPSNNQQGSRSPQGSRPAIHAPHPEGSVHNYHRVESAPNSHSANNDNKQRGDSVSNSQSANINDKNRKRERERARYAAMSQEEKNARYLRQREVRQKKKGAGCIIDLCCYKYITYNLDGSRFQGSYKLFGSFNTSTCFLTFSYVFLLWFWSMCGYHNISKRIQVEFLALHLISRIFVRVLLLYILIIVQTICRGGWCIER
ncbi:hypothetical protein C2845_PM11G18710 [Panicum miliaceum]|uniref:BZIP domain-containing protein n=1 Tax=Panicum miliaceum TaxID=4540 RepID=A0A3L6RMD2_PANMI|nr:hypothetical protein C2845_PM11G18710 [Panicum miliaceum]